MISKICPCLSWFSSKAKPSRKGYGYEQKNQLEQQQFMHKLQSETKDTSYSNQLINEEIPIQEQLENALSQQNDYQEHDLKVKQVKKREKDITPQIKEPTIAQQQKQQQVESNPLVVEQAQKQNNFENLGELQLNLPEYGQNYLLLKQKAYNAAQLLDITQNATEISLNAGKSQQQSKLKINKSKFKIWRKNQPNCYIIEYELPCSYSFYNEANNRKITPKQNDKIFREYKIIESIQPNLTLRYLCLNKIGPMQPRDFTYLKYTNNSSTHPSSHWQVCISKNPERDQANSPTNVKSGKLYSVSYIIQEKVGQGKANLKVRTYFSLEIATTLEKVWENLLNQTRSYIDELWEEAANNYADELV